MRAVLALACAAALALPACVSVGTTDRLASTCQIEASAHLVFVSATLVARVPAKVVETERLAHAVATGICLGPPPTDVNSALLALADALASVQAAQLQADARR